MTPEGAVKNQILSYLKSKQIFAFPVDSVGIFDPVKKIYRKKHSQYHLNGVSDILGLYEGKFLAIEVKSKTGKLSPEQFSFISEINSRGGLAFMARSVEDVVANLKA
jgi:penicillin-binding protein-related factor A (putative recombinase)